MKVFKTIGSKERLVEIFQNVNKIKINESLGEANQAGVDAMSALNMAFQQLKSKSLKIEQSNTQVNGSDTYVELICRDNQGNNITFTFKLSSSEGDQEDVFNVNNVVLDSFSFDSANGEDAVDLGQEALSRFNMQHAREFFDVIENYVDFESPESMDDIQETIELIDGIRKDSYPFGGGRDNMQTGVNYADHQPTNPALRVKAPELEKTIQESNYNSETRQNLINYLVNVWSKDPVAQSVQGRHPELAKYFRFNVDDFNRLTDEELQYIWDLSEKIANGQIQENEVDEMSTFRNPDKVDMNTHKMVLVHLWSGTPSGVKVAVFVKRRKKDTGEEVWGLYPNKPITFVPYDVLKKPEVAFLEGQAGKEFLQQHGYKLVQANKTIAPIAKPQPPIREDIDDMEFDSDGNPVDVVVDDEPNNVEIEDNTVEEVSPEKRAKIIAAYNNILARKGQNYAPTVAEIQAELDNINGVVKSPMVKTRTFPKEAEPFLEEGDDKSEYPDEIGKKFKPKSHYPKKKKKQDSTVNISESTDIDRFENVVFLQGDEAYEPLERLKNDGPDAALEYLKQWHYPGEHEGTDHESHGTGDKVYRKDGYILSWNPALDYIGLQYDLSQMNEEVDGENQISQQSFDTENPETAEVDQLAKEKEESGDILQGGLADGKSPLEFDPDQILKGLEVEMEHTSDPLAALEIAMDHLVEDPEYYSVKDDPEASAQANAAADAHEKHPLSDILDSDGNEDNLAQKNIENGGRFGINRALVTNNIKSDDKDLTDALLGYKSMNVGDEIPQ